MYRLRKLPYKKDYITADIYKYLSDANYSLGELKGVLNSLSDLNIILRLLNTYESKNSCDIEGIHTTYNEIFLKSVTKLKKDENTTSVIHHLRAINILFKDTLYKNSISMNDIHNIQRFLCPNDQGIRKLRGHKIYNKLTNDVLFVPPQNQNAIVDYYTNLINYINSSDKKYDPLIKMAIIHYQFECIHPYKDGNGRVGRILNSMSLVQSKRLNYPILNLSKYLNTTKEEYFSLLEKCHNNIKYIDEFIIYILKGINETTKFTINFINQITRTIHIVEHETLMKLPKIFSNELISHLFKYPYTKNELIRIDCNLSRTTATKYLKSLEEIGVLESFKYGKEVVYKNTSLLHLFNS